MTGKLLHHGTDHREAWRIVNMFKCFLNMSVFYTIPFDIVSRAISSSRRLEREAP
jgi:hypothetical protein